MERILSKIDAIVNTYESGEWQSVDSLRELLRDLSCCNYHLSKYNIEYHKDFNSIQFNFDGSVAAGKIKAEEEIPQLRQVRKIMEAADNVIWSMKSELSIIKKES